MDLSQAIITEHAAEQMAKRQIALDDVIRVLKSPSEVLPVRTGRVVAHGMVGQPERPYLLRVFVDIDRKPPEVVTVYRTSKIDKYRSQP